MMDLLSSLFSIRASFIYAIENEQYTREIAGNNGDYQEYCRIIQEELRHRCIECDRDKFREANEKRSPVLYRCLNGLYEMFLPVFIEDTVVGYLHFGQVRSVGDFRTIARECSLHVHTKFDELRKSYNSMQVIDKEKLILISKLFQKFSEIILKNALIELKRIRPEHYLRKYIEDNLGRPVSIHSAAGFVSRSPSYVTHKFKEIYGDTFHRYLNIKRIEQAKKLLRTHSISQTYPLCGFNNRYHFSKVFKEIEGITPRKFQLTRDE
jgi:AraC-like DNA-binding protein